MKALFEPKRRPFCSEKGTGGGKSLILMFLIVLGLISMVYGLIDTVSTFEDQNNPFNITFAQSRNITYFLSYPIYGNISNTSISIIPLNTLDHCYQETANKTSSCGGLSTGVYDLSGIDINPFNAIDENYSTFATSSAPGGNVYINYTKPANAINVTWQIKQPGNLTNLTIPEKCFDTYNDTVSFRVNVNPVSPSMDWGCWNSTNWHRVKGAGTSSASLYEEAVFWYFTKNISIYTGSTLEYSDIIKNQNISLNLLNNILNEGCTCNNCSIENDNCNIPITFNSDVPGIIQVNLTNATYEYGVDNCSTFTYPFLNFSYYDQDTLAPITTQSSYDLTFNGGFTQTLQQTYNSVYSHNFCTNINITPRGYNISTTGELTLKKDTYGTKLFSITGATALSSDTTSPHFQKLYLIPLNESSTVIFTWLTSAYEPIDGTMEIYECVGDGSRTLLESTPIVNGEASANIVLINSIYSYEIVVDGTRYTDSSGFTQCHPEPDANRQYLVNIGGADYTQPVGMYSIDCNITKTGNSTVLMAWSNNPESTETLTGCIYANRITSIGSTLIYSNCTSLSNSIERTIPSSGFTYSVYGKLFQGGYSMSCGTDIEFDVDTSAGDKLGLSGVYAVILLVVGMVLLFSNTDPKYTPIMAIGALIGAFILGILSFGWMTISALLFFVIIIIILGRYHKKE